MGQARVVVEFETASATEAADAVRTWTLQPDCRLNISYTEESPQITTDTEGKPVDPPEEA